MDSVWNFVVVNIADLITCYTDTKNCFGEDYSNIVVALAPPVFSGLYSLAWTIWCAHWVVWCIILTLSFRLVATNFSCYPWSLILTWFLFLQSQKPWNFDPDELNERNRFAIQDLYQGWAIILAQAAFFSLTQAPKKIHEAMIRLTAYVESNLDFELCFSDVWIACISPATAGSRADAEMRHLLEEDAAMRSRRRLWKPNSEPSTSKMSGDKFPRLSRTYSLIPQKQVLKAFRLDLSKTAQLRLEFRYSSVSASTQTENINCEHRIGEEYEKICLGSSRIRDNSDVVSDLPSASVDVTGEIKGYKHVTAEDAEEEDVHISTGVHWDSWEGISLKGEDATEKISVSENLELESEVTTEIQFPLELGEDEHIVPEESKSSNEAIINEVPAQIDTGKDTQEDVPLSTHQGTCQGTYQYVWQDDQQGKQDEASIPNVSTIQKATGMIRAEAPRAAEVLEMEEGLTANDPPNTTQISPQHESTNEIAPNVLSIPEFSLPNCNFWAVKNAAMALGVDQEHTGIFDTERKIDSDRESDDEMSLFNEMYSDDHGNDAEGPSLGPGELNARLLSIFEQNDAQIELPLAASNTDETTIPGPREDKIPLDIEMGLETELSEISELMESDIPCSPRDVHMDSGSEPDTSEIDNQDIHMNCYDVEENQFVMGGDCVIQAQIQQETEIQMSEAFDDYQPLPGPALDGLSDSIKADQEDDELERDLWAALEHHDDELFEVGQPTLGAVTEPQAYFVNNRTLDLSVPTGTIAETCPDVPISTSYEHSGQNLDVLGNESQDQNIEESGINNDDKIATRIKLVPKSRRARQTRQADRQPQDRSTEQIFNPLHLLSQEKEGLEVTGKAPEAWSESVENIQDDVETLRGTPEPPNEPQASEPNDGPEESKDQGQVFSEAGIEGPSEERSEQSAGDKEGVQKNEPSPDIQPMQLGLLKLPGGNHGVLSPLNLPPPASSIPSAPSDALVIDAEGGSTVDNPPANPDSETQCHIGQTDHAPTTPRGKQAESLTPESLRVLSGQNTDRKHVSDLQKRSLSILKKRYAKSHAKPRSSPRLFHSPRRTETRQPSTPDRPSRTGRAETPLGTEITGGPSLSQTSKSAVKIISPAVLIRHLEEARHEESED